jgi:hypothetical protein
MQFGFAFVQAIAKILDGSEQGLDILAAGLRFANTLGAHITLVPQRFSVDLKRLALLVESQIGVRVKHMAAPRQILGNLFSRLSQ